VRSDTREAHSLRLRLLRPCAARAAEFSKGSRSDEDSIQGPSKEEAVKILHARKEWDDGRADVLTELANLAGDRVDQMLRLAKHSIADVPGDARACPDEGSGSGRRTPGAAAEEGGVLRVARPGPT
jgi:hypothetical protein